MREYPRAYAFYFSRSSEHQRLITLFNRFLAYIDMYDSIDVHESGERKLIDKYVKQDNLRLIFQVSSAFSIILILFLWFSIKKYKTINRQLIFLNQKIHSQKKELEQLNKTDALTGLFTKQHFENILDHYQQSAQTSMPLSLMIIDVDHFKQVNDHYGHLVGDDYLRIIGQIIKQHIAREQDVAARYGGEEFVCLLPETSQQAAYHLAEQIRSGIEHRQLPNYEVGRGFVTVSIGIATIHHSDYVVNLFASADEQLYIAKGTGRNRTCYVESMSAN